MTLTVKTVLPARPPRRRRRTEPSGVIAVVLLTAGAAIIIVPFLFMVSTSLNRDAWLSIPFPAQIIPNAPTFEAYEVAIESLDLGQLYLNTALIAAFQIAISLFSAVLSGYALSKVKPRGGHWVMVLVLTTMMIPNESTMIPNFLTFKALGMLDTYLPFWIPALAYTFGTFFVKQYLDGVPDELREAAKLDGANELRILFQIFLPLAKPVLATCTILIFMGVWNNFLWPLIIINSPELYTLQMGIAAFSLSVGDSQYMLPAVNMAATVLSVIPVLIVYLALQRYVVASVASSAIKG